MTWSALPGKRKLKPSGSLLVVGDSIAAGAQLFDPVFRFGAIVAAARGLTEHNVAVAGSVVDSWVEDQLGSRTYARGDVAILMPGFNNARYSGADATKLRQYVSDLTGALCFAALPDSARLYTQVLPSGFNDAELDFVGTWSGSPTWAGAEANSRSGAYSAAAAAHVEGTVTGDSVHVMAGSYPATDSAIAVYIDGTQVGYGNVMTRPVAGMADGGGDLWRPVCIRIPGLSPGEHVVRVEVGQDSPTLVGYIAGYNARDGALPALYVLSPIRMTTAGYAEVPANANDDVVRLYQDATRRVVATLAAEGLMVRYVDVDVGWYPSENTVDADNVHPLSFFHALAAQAVLAEMAQPYLTP